MIRFAFAAMASIVLFGTSSDMYDGRPTIDRSHPTGYYLWRGGDQWHLRWVAIDHGRVFKGSVTAEGGGFGSMRQIDPSAEGRSYLSWVTHMTVTVGRANGSRISQAGPPPQSNDRTSIQRNGVAQIIFDSRINDNISGFDFSADDSVAVLRFDLQVDGKARLEMLRIGRDNQAATEFPLVVNLKVRQE